MNRKICDINAGRLIEGLDFRIYGVSDEENPENNTIIYVKKKLEQSDSVRECIVIAAKPLNIAPGCHLIISEKPKNDFSALLKKLDSLITKNTFRKNDDSYLASDLKLGKNSRIGKFCIIENNVEIGNDCEIGDYCLIKAHTVIGHHVVVKDRCSIGVDDCDIYREDEHICETLPHMAGTIIENGCLILSGSIIAAGDTRTTLIKKGVMIGAGSHIGHNCIVGENTLIGAHSCICGHCDLGKEVYIAPKSNIMNRLHIGDNAHIGLSSVVIQDIASGDKVFGNPALRIPVKNR